MTQAPMVDVSAIRVGDAPPKAQRTYLTSIAGETMVKAMQGEARRTAIR